MEENKETLSGEVSLEINETTVTPKIRKPRVSRGKTNEKPNFEEKAASTRTPPRRKAKNTAEVSYRKKSYYS